MRQHDDGRWISADGQLVWDGTRWVPKHTVARRSRLPIVIMIASALILIFPAGIFWVGVYLVSSNRAPAATGSGPCQANEPISLTVVIDDSPSHVCTAKAPICKETGSRPAAVLHLTAGLRNSTPSETLRMDFNPSPDPSWSNKTYDVGSGGLNLFLDAGLPFPETGGWQSTKGSAILSVTSRQIAGTVDVQASGTASVYTDAHITGSWACSIAS